MTKVIAVDGFVSAEGVVEIREKVEDHTPAGWKVIVFGTNGAPGNHFNDLIRRLNLLNAKTLTDLEIVAEGAPKRLDQMEVDALPDTPEAVGPRLKTVPGLTKDTRIFLSGCNTGCHTATKSFADEVAQRLANAAQSDAIFGARGYITGAHALGNESCRKEFAIGDPRTVYKESTAAAGMDSWKRFIAKKGPPAPPTPIGLPMMMPELSPADAETLLKDLEAPDLKVPPFRVAPDRVISLDSLGRTGQTIQVIANGSYFRDPVTYRVWRNSMGPRIIAPARASDGR